MAQQIINIGSAANDGTGDPLRTAFTKCNDNFTELYAGDLSPPQGRLTLTTATPVMTASVSAATTIYYTPYVGNKVPIYDGASWAMLTFAELSGSLAGAAANKVQDWFIWNNGGTITLVKSPDWTNDTTRSLDLIRIGGLWVNNGAISGGPASQRGTYVGTTRTEAAGTTKWVLGGVGSGGVAAYLYVWNAYNRVPVGTRVSDSAASWTKNDASFGVAHNSGNNAVYFVSGLTEEGFVASYNVAVSSGASGDAIIGIGYDTTANVASQAYSSTGGTVSTLATAWSSINLQGYHLVFPVEAQNLTTNPATFYGVSAGHIIMNFSFFTRM